MLGSGNQTAIDFADSEFSGRFSMIGNVDFELGEEDVSGLETEDYAEFEPHDLQTMSDTEIELFFDSKAQLPDLGVHELITVTYPQRADESAPATFAAIGYFKKYGLPQAVNNTTMKVTATIKWSNRGTAPTWTPATESV